MIISDGIEARMGSLNADSERYARWRTIDGVTIDPLGEFNELETLVRGFSTQLLLDYLVILCCLKTMVAVKKIAGYHQFHAVRSAIQQMVGVPLARRAIAKVAWYGIPKVQEKSITMTCFAARVMQEVAMENPTILVITDRNDLDGQLFGVFSCRKIYCVNSPFKLKRAASCAKN